MVTLAATHLPRGMDGAAVGACSSRVEPEVLDATPHVVQCGVQGGFIMPRRTGRKTDFLPGIIALALITSAAAASAATTGVLTLQGVVAAATAITVTGAGGFSELDLATSANDLQVASVREINNTTNGYTVSLTSQNAGVLKNGSIGNVNYTAKYNSQAVTLSATPVTVTTSAPSTKGFTISYAGTAAANMMVGTYSDTLTFTIAAL
jgi:hypothetical protein